MQWKQKSNNLQMLLQLLNGRTQKLRQSFFSYFNNFDDDSQNAQDEIKFQTGNKMLVIQL